MSSVLGEDVDWRLSYPWTDSRQAIGKTKTSILSLRRPWRAKSWPSTNDILVAGSFDVGRWGAKPQSCDSRISRLFPFFYLLLSYKNIYVWYVYIRSLVLRGRDSCHFVISAVHYISNCCCTALLLCLSSAAAVLLCCCVCRMVDVTRRRKNVPTFSHCKHSYLAPAMICADNAHTSPTHELTPRAEFWRNELLNVSWTTTTSCTSYEVIRNTW